MSICQWSALFCRAVCTFSRIGLDIHIYINLQEHTDKIAAIKSEEKNGKQWKNAYKFNKLQNVNESFSLACQSVWAHQFQSISLRSEINFS